MDLVGGFWEHSKARWLPIFDQTRSAHEPLSPHQSHGTEAVARDHTAYMVATDCSWASTGTSVFDSMFRHCHRWIGVDRWIEHHGRSFYHDHSRLALSTRSEKGDPYDWSNRRSHPVMAYCGHNLVDGSHSHNAADRVQMCIGVHLTQVCHHAYHGILQGAFSQPLCSDCTSAFHCQGGARGLRGEEWLDEAHHWVSV